MTARDKRCFWPIAPLAVATARTRRSCIALARRSGERLLRLQASLPAKILSFGHPALEACSLPSVTVVSLTAASVVPRPKT